MHILPYLVRYEASDLEKTVSPFATGMRSPETAPMSSLLKRTLTRWGMVSLLNWPSVPVFTTISLEVSFTLRSLAVYCHFHHKGCTVLKMLRIFALHELYILTAMTISTSHRYNSLCSTRSRSTSSWLGRRVSAGRAAGKRMMRWGQTAVQYEPQRNVKITDGIDMIRDNINIL